MVYYVDTTYDYFYIYKRHIFIIAKKDGRNTHMIQDNQLNSESPETSLGYKKIKDSDLIKVIFSKDKW